MKVAILSYFFAFDVCQEQVRIKNREGERRDGDVGFWAGAFTGVSDVLQY